MKRIVLLLIALGMMDLAIPAAAQQHRHTRRHHRRHMAPQQNTTYNFPKAQKNREHEKSLDDGTTGVQGRDQIKMNEKGKYRNLNANTGVALPPSSGNNSK